MKSLRWLMVAGAWAALVTSASAADVRDAVVRIPSHGGSGTVIETGPGKTKILSAAHVFRDPKTGKINPNLIKIDVPDPGDGTLVPHKAPMQVTKVTTFQTSDLALLEIDDGPWPTTCPVAPPGHQPGRNLLSVGYAKMQTPAAQVRSTLTNGILGNDRTFTREPPTPGMSGGALIDLDAGVLIGVTSAINSFGQGCYVKHSDILAFLNGGSPSPPNVVNPKGYIRIEEDRSGTPAPPPMQPLPAPAPPALDMQGPFSGPFAPAQPWCPNGQCPNQPRTQPDKPGFLDYPDGSGRKLKLMTPIPRGE